MWTNVSFDTADCYSVTNDTHYIFDDDSVNLSKEESHDINVTLDWGDVYKMMLSKNNKDIHTLESCKESKSTDTLDDDSGSDVAVSSEHGVNDTDALQGTTATFGWAFSPLDKNFQNSARENTDKLKNVDDDEYGKDSSPPPLLNASTTSSVLDTSFSSEDENFDDALVVHEKENSDTSDSKLLPHQEQGTTVAEDIYYAACKWFSKKSCQEPQSFLHQQKDTQHSLRGTYDASLNETLLHLSAISYFDDTLDLDDDDGTYVHVNGKGGTLQGTAVAGEKQKNVYDEYGKDFSPPPLLNASTSSSVSDTLSCSSSSEDEIVDDALDNFDKLMLPMLSRCFCLW